MSLEQPPHKPFWHDHAKQTPSWTLQLPPASVAGHPRIRDRSSPTVGRCQPPPSRPRVEQYPLACCQIINSPADGGFCHVSPEVGSVQVGQALTHCPSRHPRQLPHAPQLPPQPSLPHSLPLHGFPQSTGQLHWSSPTLHWSSPQKTWHCWSTQLWACAIQS